MDQFLQSVSSLSPVNLQLNNSTIVEEGIGAALLPDGFTERERQQN